MKRSSFIVLLIALVSGWAFAAPGIPVIIHCDGNCNAAVRSVKAAGGSITYRYKYVNAIAADLPFDRYSDVTRGRGVARVYKDVVIDLPRDVDSVKLDTDFQALDVTPLEAIPADWLESMFDTNVGPLFGAGELGDGVKVAVIDTGTAPVIAFDRSGCDTTDPTVIGGEMFIASAGGGEPPATSFFNNNHGTQVSTQIAGNTILGLPNAHPWAVAVATHSPSSAIVDIVPGTTGLPLIGTAPCAQIYALKVFPASGAGAPRSDIAAAMERAIELRENFNNGMPSAPVSGSGTSEDPFVFDSLEIDIVNMSLGGATLFSGFEITDQLTEVMLGVGITPVISAGNSGHAAMTVGSPGTGTGALTAGAASLVQNERILRDLQFGAGIGPFYRPADHHQMSTFSSRGPIPDGRVGVDAVANGFANLALGADGGAQGIWLVSGTSLSAPTIAGAAATLRGAAPGASAVQIRNALVETADPGFLGDNSAPIDQGAGFINVADAFAALQAGTVSSDLPVGPADNSVRGNIAKLGLDTIQLGKKGFSTHIADLVPGQIAHFFVQTTANTDALIIDFSNVSPELPPGQQNAFFGDDLFVLVQDAVTSTSADLAGGFIFTDTTLVAENPQSGLVRVAVMGDWTNAGKISTDISIKSVVGKKPKNFDRDRLRQGDFKILSVDVPASATQANFELRWQQDWGRYPTDDLDLILIDPNGDLYLECCTAAGNPFVPGATLKSPERVVVDDPIPGEWTVILDGFTVWGNRGSRAQYNFHAFDQDGKSF